MREPESAVRNRVRAVIVENGHLLLLRKVYADRSERFVLPGGSQEAGETLAVALQRECREEIDTQVSISGILYLADFFKPRSSEPDSYRQQVEFFFLCSPEAGYKPRNGYRPDKHQVEVLWVPLTRLRTINLFPTGLADLFADRGFTPFPVYLGSIDP